MTHFYDKDGQGIKSTPHATDPARSIGERYEGAAPAHHDEIAIRRGRDEAPKRSPEPVGITRRREDPAGKTGK